MSITWSVETGLIKLPDGGMASEIHAPDHIHLGQHSRAADTHQGRHLVGRGTHPGVEEPVVLTPASPFTKGASALAMVLVPGRIQIRCLEAHL